MTTGDQRKKEKRNRRVFSLEFKQEAVELVVKEGYSLRENCFLFLWF